MNFRVGLFFIAIVFFLQKSANAQCDDTTARVRSYDSTVIGSSNDFYTFTFPKFDATVGTLVDVTFTSKVTLNFAFKLENRESNDLSYRVRLIREHEISSDALMTPLTNTRSVTYGPYVLSASDGVAGSGSDYITKDSLKPLNNYTVNQTVVNTADYMGNDSLNFDYISSATSYAIGSLNNTYTSLAHDTLNLRISYRYCPTSQLATDISQVIAYEKNDKTYIKWSVLNEPSGRTYHVQRSNSAKGFVNIATVNGDFSKRGQYEFIFDSPSAKGKAQFRVVSTDKIGKASNSRVRLVDYGGEENNSSVKIFPNPSSGSAQLMFDNTRRDDYDVRVLSMSGQLVKQYQFRNVLMARINEEQELRKGIYLVRCIKKNSGVQQIQKLVIQ